MFTKEEKKKKRKKRRGEQQGCFDAGCVNHRRAPLPFLSFSPLSWSMRENHTEESIFPPSSVPDTKQRARDSKRLTRFASHALTLPPVSPPSAYAVFLIPRIRVHCLPSGRGGGGCAGSKRKSLRCPKFDLCHRRVCPGGIVPRNNAATSYNYVKYTIRTRELYIIYGELN